MSSSTDGANRTFFSTQARRKRDPSKEVLEEVDDAYHFADEAPDPAPQELFTHVYANP